MLDSSVINQVPAFKPGRASVIGARLEPSPRSHLVLESDVSIIQYDTRIFGSSTKNKISPRTESKFSAKKKETKTRTSKVTNSGPSKKGKSSNGQSDDGEVDDLHIDSEWDKQINDGSSTFVGAGSEDRKWTKVIGPRCSIANLIRDNVSQIAPETVQSFTS
jgi:hypothetical protein